MGSAPPRWRTPEGPAVSSGELSPALVGSRGGESTVSGDEAGPWVSSHAAGMRTGSMLGYRDPLSGPTLPCSSTSTCWTLSFLAPLVFFSALERVSAVLFFAQSCCSRLGAALPADPRNAGSRSGASGSSAEAPSSAPAPSLLSPAPAVAPSSGPAALGLPEGRDRDTVPIPVLPGSRDSGRSSVAAGIAFGTPGV